MSNPWAIPVKASEREKPLEKTTSLFDFAPPGTVIGGADLSQAWTLRFDGACLYNGQAKAKAGYGFYILDEYGETIVEKFGPR